MFTGIISEVGTVQSLKKDEETLKLEIAAPLSSKKLKNGGSIAIDGACFTVIRKKANSFTVEAMPETISKTIISSYKKGARLNLEAPVSANSPLDGHFVLGHIDDKGTVTKVSGRLTKNITIKIPKKLSKYVSLKGSIAINGVSLTVSGITKNELQVSLIPETLRHTNLSSLKPSDKVNIEVDMLSRYMESLLAQK